MLKLAWLSSSRWPCSSLIVPNFRSASFSWRKILPDGLGHLGLHGQQPFLALAERVRLETQQSLQQQSIGRQRLRGEELLHAGVGNGQDLRADVAGGLRRAPGQIDVPALHPLILLSPVSSLVFKWA